MGKGFNNYMNKKFFHPASRDNLKRVWMAEQKSEAYKKKQEELRMQYEKEQDLYDNKAMLSKDSKDKLSVNFMYEPPPGTKKESTNEPIGGPEEVRFEWQRKYQAPRESYCKDDVQVRDQPFGIQVRNVRCIKCHKWGHINTDKECSMYALSMSEAREIHSKNLIDESTSVRDNLSLEKQMLCDGLALRKAAVPVTHHELIQETSAESKANTDHPELEFIKTLSTTQKKNLLKKLEKLEKRNHKKSQKKIKEKKRRHHISESDSSSSSDSDAEKRKKHRKTKRHDKQHDHKRLKHKSKKSHK